MCNARPSRTVTTYHASDRRRSKPNRDVLVNNKHATAYGAIFMIMSMIFVEISNNASRTWSNAAVLSAGNKVIAIATTIAKNMRWSMFGVGEATAAIGFDGTIVCTTCISGDGARP